jgi:hypothetical protein
MVLHIAPDGTVTTLYQEFLHLAALGALRIERASHVEPDSQGQWWAHVIDGPTLGPYPSRSAALAAEVDWLVTHRLGGPVPVEPKDSALLQESS